MGRESSMFESLCQFGPIIALAGLHFGDARIFAALAGDADGRGGLRRLKTEAASTLAFGREIARSGSRRPQVNSLPPGLDPPEPTRLAR